MSVLVGPCSVAQANLEIGKLDSLITKLIIMLLNARPTTHAQLNVLHQVVLAYTHDDIPSVKDRHR